MDAEPPPLTLAELDATLGRIGGFEARPLIAVALSGGPDSLALMLLADRWARQRRGRAWGLTVDHGLRPESGQEARLLGGWLAARAIPHAILVWSGDKPATGIQEAAREARYGLLAEWCRTAGCLHLLTGHHREDQAETYLIRRRAGSGIDGLAGMAAVRELTGCRVVRPLLAFARARLAAFLAAEDQPYLRDPSNLNPRFERVRVRQSLAATDEIIAETRVCGLARRAREEALDRLIGFAVAVHPAGFASLDRVALTQCDAELAERLLAAVAACVGGARYPLRRARVGRLRAGLMAQPGRARTLGGCRFVPWRDRVLVLRELAAASPSATVEAGSGLLWDRRFAVALSADATAGFSLGYLGAAGAQPTQMRRLREGGLPPLTQAALPVFRDRDGLAAVPHLGYRRAGVGPLPELLFAPANPLTRAPFTVV